MEGQVPVEVAALPGALREEFEQGTARAGHQRVWMVLGRPVVLQREVDPGVRRMAAEGFPGEPDLVFVLTGDLLGVRRPHLVPLVVRVHLVADDPAPDSAMGGVRRRPPPGDEVGEGFVAGASFGGYRVSGHRRAFGRVGFRVDGQGADAFVGRAIRNHDERDQHSPVAQRLDLAVHRLSVLLVNREREAIGRGGELPGLGFLLGRKQAVEGDV